MKCSKYDLLINKYMDSELNPGEKKMLEKHTNICGSCSAKLSFFLKLKEKTENITGIYPKEEFTASVLSKIEDIPQHSRQPYESFMLRIRWAIATTAAIVSILMPICGY
jgi:hypothetical protein